MKNNHTATNAVKNLSVIGCSDDSWIHDICY